MKVGLIGCGRIANQAHLPAYKKYGVCVSSVCDKVLSKAKKLADDYQIPHFCTDPIELVTKDDVDIVDIATQPKGRSELIEMLIPYKKPLLIQKPLAYDYEEAERLANLLKTHNIPTAINHNARWAPVQVEFTKWLEQGLIGEIYAIHHVNRFNEDLRSWYTDHPDYMFIDHGLHYLDLVRYHTKRIPVAISATSSFGPAQKAKCPLLYNINILYDRNKPLAASLYFNNIVPAPHGFYCNWFIDGTKASVIMTIDSISRVANNGISLPLTRIEGEWIPEGFIGTYKHFVDSIKSGVEPTHSAADHLISLKIATAAAKSARENGQWININ